jgi:hypothetical protein
VRWNRSYLSLPHLAETDRGKDHDGIEFALPDGDGGFVLVGWWYTESSDSRYGWITRVGVDGIPWWNRIDTREDVNSFRDEFADGVVTDDGFLLAGRTIASEYDDEERGDGWVVEIDERSGRVDWERAYDPTGPVDGWPEDERHSEFNAVDGTDDGYLVAGVAGDDERVRELHDSEMRGRSWAAKLDTRGRVVWQNNPGGKGFYAVEPAGDGAVLVGRRNGRGWVLAYDEDGDRLGSDSSSVPGSGYTALTAWRRDSRREYLPVGYGRRGGVTSGLGSRFTADDLGDDGDDGDDEQLLDIVATESGEVRYEFTVDGDVERARVNNRIKAEDGDRIRENDDGTVTVRGSTGNRGFGNAFRFTGEVTAFESEGDADFFLRVDGERVSVDEFPEDWSVVSVRRRKRSGGMVHTAADRRRAALEPPAGRATGQQSTDTRRNNDLTGAETTV